MIEWYGAWIDSLFRTARYGAFGARLLTLLGSLPLLIFLSVSSGISILIVVTRSTGSDINLMANAQMPPDAILLPRWGVQMKTTRLMRGLALKVVAFATRSVGRSVAKICMAGFPSVCSQSARVMLVTCACESNPPILWPTRT